jgi:hemolysin-activating ACP:hemolysin acyltransferase
MAQVLGQMVKRAEEAPRYGKVAVVLWRKAFLPQLRRCQLGRNSLGKGSRVA